MRNRAHENESTRLQPMNVWAETFALGSSLVLGCPSVDRPAGEAVYV